VLTTLADEAAVLIAGHVCTACCALGLVVVFVAARGVHRERWLLLWLLVLLLLSLLLSLLLLVIFVFCGGVIVFVVVGQHRAGVGVGRERVVRLLLA
jgi:hypothetical protein